MGDVDGDVASYDSYRSADSGDLATTTRLLEHTTPRPHLWRGLSPRHGDALPGPVRLV